MNIPQMVQHARNESSSDPQVMQAIAALENDDEAMLALVEYSAMVYNQVIAQKLNDDDGIPPSHLPVQANANAFAFAFAVGTLYGRQAEREETTSLEAMVNGLDAA